MPDPQVYAYQQTLSWHAWSDRPLREAIGKDVAQGLREYVIMQDADVDWDTLDGPREIGRTWRHDTGELDEDGEPIYAYLPTPPDEDPEAPPSLVLVRAEVTGRPRPKAPVGGTLSA